MTDYAPPDPDCDCDLSDSDVPSRPRSGPGTDDPAADDRRSSVGKECPQCGERMVTATFLGPGEHYAHPCGCSLTVADLW